MSQYIKSALYLIVLTMFCACSGGGSSDEPYVSTEYLNVTSQLTLSTNGSQSGTLDIKANCSWTISGNPSWMTLSQNSGSNDAKVTITCTPNPSAIDERSAVISVSSASGKVKRSVTISQPASDETLSVNVTEISFGVNSESKVLSIQSNADWHITGIEDWFTLSKTSGSGNSDITVTALSNENGSLRSATITIQGANKSARVLIRQEALIRTLAVSPTTISATSIGQTYQLILSGDATWSASCNASWCTLDKYNGVGSDVLTVTVEDNASTTPRDATISFSTKTDTYTCTVSQAAAKLPEITSVSVTDIDKHSFKIQASYTSEFPVTECGICYSDTQAEPTLSDTSIKCEALDGAYSATLSGLKSAHTYYVRAYVTGIVGTTYSDVLTVSTVGSAPGADDNLTPEI